MAEMIPNQQGRIVVVQSADPSKGNEINYTQPARVRWRLKSFVATLVTDVTVADRLPELVIFLGVHEVLRITAAQPLGADSTFIYGWHEGERALALTDQTSRITALPRNYLLNNQAIIGTLTVNLQGNDNWSAAVIVAEEWIEPLA